MFGKVTGVLRYALYFILFCVLLRACGSMVLHDHEWQDASCTTAKTCTICGATDGDPLGHQWEEATCTSPRTCSRCSEIEGVRAAHSWIDATCTEPERCSSCGKSRHWYSMALGHDWEDATCTAPKTCSRCGATDGEPKHHFISYSWDTIVEATCQTKGEQSHACTLCGAVETRTVPIAKHKGEWEIVQEATASTPGKRAEYCIWCGIELGSLEIPYISPSGGGPSTGGNSNNFNTHNNAGQQNTTASYVLNTSTKRFHRPSCRDVPRIASQNYSTSNLSRSDLISNGYKACGHCNP